MSGRPANKSQLLVVILFLVWSQVLQATELSFYKGADISSLQELEADSVSFYANGLQDDALNILKNGGVNSVRLRLWHTPEEPWNNLAQTVEMAQRIKAAGLHFLLDIHYSDWWADPAHQTPPSAWENLTFQQMTDSVSVYTEMVMSRLLDAGALPDMVQVGNEVGCGMLWPFGDVCGSNNTPEQWQQFADLLNAGIDAVHNIGGDSIQIMIHDFRGGDATGAGWFFSNLVEYGVSFDIIGLSYYPWWHGTLDNLAANMGTLAYTHEKPVVVVETAYPWTLGWNDNTNNIIGQEDQLLAGYEASPQGQASFLSDLIGRVENVWGGFGTGVFYWEPAWISGNETGSPWENLALFDFSGASLEALDVFQEPVAVSEARTMVQPDEVLIYPNPSNSRTRINFRLNDQGETHLSIYSIQGTLIMEHHFTGAPHSTMSWTWSHGDLHSRLVPSGVYLFKQEGLVSKARKILVLK